MLCWQEIVENYIIKYSNKIRKTTQPLRDHFGIDYFTYHRIDNSGKYTVLVDRPDWAELYVGEQFYLIDPYLRNTSNYTSGLTLFENHGSENYKETILKAAKERLNIEFYFENIKNKLSCWNKQEVFQIAKILSELGLLP